MRSRSGTRRAASTTARSAAAVANAWSRFRPRVSRIARAAAANVSESRRTSRLRVLVLPPAVNLRLGPSRSARPRRAAAAGTKRQSCPRTRRARRSRAKRRAHASRTRGARVGHRRARRGERTKARSPTCRPCLGRATAREPRAAKGALVLSPTFEPAFEHISKRAVFARTHRSPLRYRGTPARVWTPPAPRPAAALVRVVQAQKRPRRRLAFSSGRYTRRLRRLRRLRPSVPSARVRVPFANVSKRTAQSAWYAAPEALDRNARETRAASSRSASPPSFVDCVLIRGRFGAGTEDVPSRGEALGDPLQVEARAAQRLRHLRAERAAEVRAVRLGVREGRRRRFVGIKTRGGRGLDAS